ncbi:MAG: DUF6580 family putative transport protein [Bacteroidota bacterium]
MSSPTTFQRFAIIGGLILLAALSRLLPHPPNFTPLAAMALFGAAYLQRSWLVWLLPFVAFYLSDLVLNNWVYAAEGAAWNWSVNWGVYAAFALIILLGIWQLRKRNWTSAGLALTGLAGTLLFYAITNFLSWYVDPFQMYPNGIEGLWMSLAAGLPFLANSLMGTAFFGAILFGSAAALQVPRVAPQAA